MSVAYECCECYRVFDKDEAYGQRETNFYEAQGVPFRETSIIDSCPYCGSDQLDEIRLCDKCDLNPAKDDGWCEECLGKYAKPNPLDPWMDALSQELKEMGP